MHGGSDVEAERPADLRGFGNVLLWMVAIHAPDLVDRVYAAGRVRRLGRYGTVDDHYVPSPALIGWLLTAAELGILPDSKLDSGGDFRRIHHPSMKAQVSRAFNGEPDQFKPEWFDACTTVPIHRSRLGAREAQPRPDLRRRRRVRPRRSLGAAQEHRDHTAAASAHSPTPAGTGFRAADSRRDPSGTAGFIERAPLAELADAARSGRPAVLHAVTGLRGVGKTQLAAAYARRRIADGWPLVAWMNAETRDTLITGLAEIAGRLGLADPTDPGDSLKAALLLRDRLHSRTADGLLVFDNATSPQELRPFLPATGRTQIVVTSTAESSRSLSASAGTAIRARPVAGIPGCRHRAPRYFGRSRTGGGGGRPAPRPFQAATMLSQRPYLGYAGYLRLLRTVTVGELMAELEDSSYPRPVAAALLLSVTAAEGGNPSLPGRLLRITACLSLKAYRVTCSPAWLPRRRRSTSSSRGARAVRSCPGRAPGT